MSQPHSGHGHVSTTGTPRWVKVSGIIVLILVVLFIILQLTGVAGDHGPGRHAAPGGSILTPGASGFVRHTA